MAKRCTTKRARRGLCTKKSTKRGRRGRRVAPCGRKANGQIKSCRRGRR
jgi:hypothetical protein